MTIDIYQIYNQYAQYYSTYNKVLPDNIENYKQDLLDILSRIDPAYGVNLYFPPGWIPLVVNLHKQILSVLPNYKIHQVKEKFGTLRYYINEHTDLVWNFIHEAEQQSAVTCSICSSPGKLIKKFVAYTTLCDQCANS